MVSKTLAKSVEFILDGKTVTGFLGETIIEVADRIGVYIPRFCYHKELTVAANCRMCLVEVNDGLKTLPACHMKIEEGMTVNTKSKKTRQSQQSVMEFLLINHPLDCPICDQGGECELQDVAMGFGRGVSRYVERKRAVVDYDFGSLVASDMTRCIHCTRCVRFGTEIAGVSDFGMVDRGESMHIAAYLQKGLKSELSGNCIDLCPVGALTSKPMRYRGRSWSFVNHSYVSAHDCLLSHVYVHTSSDGDLNQVMRVVPRKNDALNQGWISDRDRFGYLGLSHSERLSHPMIKDGKEWKKVSWDVALSLASERIQSVLKEFGPEQMGALISSNATVEEGFMCQKLMHSLGCFNMDFRHHQRDTDYINNAEKAYQSSFLDFSVLEDSQVVMLVGSYIRNEQPIAAMRIRQAQLNGLKVLSVNPVSYDWNFELAEEVTACGYEFVHFLASCVLSLAHYSQNKLSESWNKSLIDINRSKLSDRFAKILLKSKGYIFLGQYAQSHQQASCVHRLCVMLEAMSSVELIHLMPGVNTAGLEMIGFGPCYCDEDVHIATGQSSYDMLDKPKKLYVLQNIEPEFDFYDPAMAIGALKKAHTVVSISTYASAFALEYADILLPAAAWTEYAGSWVSVMGELCHFLPIKSLYESSKPVWKIYRVLGNMLKSKGFSYHDISELRGDIELFQTGVIQRVKSKKMSDIQSPLRRNLFPSKEGELYRIANMGIYRQDSMSRRSLPLQEMQDEFTVKVHPDTLSDEFVDGEHLLFKQGGCEVQFNFEYDTTVAVGGVLMPAGFPEVSLMSGWCDEIEVIKQEEFGK
ncbi:MAG: NADH-quinone oxidoreductase subunit NuoG [Pseudomonadota bacterium]|nr:NADH-quinone oxidoreductase subunit NuoG [Pseudomonadota bacterium]